jgi:hypothetical protein
MLVLSSPRVSAESALNLMNARRSVHIAFE